MKNKILLVDDKGEFRTILKIILQSKFEVTTAANGLEALALLQRGYIPDLIISDLMMPKIDGITLVQQVNSSDIFKHIPILILSSINEGKNKVELFRIGVADYLEKPFNPDELKVRINRLLNVS